MTRLACTSKSFLGLTLVLAAAVTGCGGNPRPASVPTVISTIAANGATGVALDSTFAAKFSEAMDPASIGTNTFTVSSPGPVVVAGNTTYAGVSATFHPTTNLSANTLYTATITTGVKSAQGAAMAANYAWHLTTAAASGSGGTSDVPAVSSTIPANAATGVALNSAVTATFSESMSAASISISTFTVTAPGAVAVAGTVTYAGGTATFRPASALASGAAFTATITTGAKNLAGNSLAADHAWSFATGFTSDSTAPTVTSTSPANNATGVASNAAISATFSKSLAPATITSSSFTVTGPSATIVSGAISWDSAVEVVTFQPASALAANTVYTANLKGGSSGLTDLSGNALASDVGWQFTTGATHVGLSPVLLGSSGNYVILAKSAISTVPTSAITGDLGLSPAAESYYTGFAQTDATGYATATQVVGKLYASDQAPPTPNTLTTAVSDMQTAYTDAAGRPTPDFLELGTGAIGGLTLSPGLYKWTSTVTIASDVTLAGSPTDVWILQIDGNLSMSSAKHVFLSGGALAKNVFWQVAGTVDLGTTAHFEGIILCQTAITLGTGASMNGRILAQTAVALDSSTVTQPAP